MQLQKQRSKCNHNNCLNSSTIWTLMWCCSRCRRFIQSDIASLSFTLRSLRFCPMVFRLSYSSPLRSCAKIGLIWRAFGGDQMVCVLLIESALVLRTYIYLNCCAVCTLVANIPKRMPLLRFFQPLQKGSIGKCIRCIQWHIHVSAQRTHTHNRIKSRRSKQKWNKVNSKREKSSTFAKYSH